MIMKGKFEEFWKAHEVHFSLAIFEYSKEFKHLFISLVAVDPNERPSILEIRNHSWLKDGMASQKEFVQEIWRKTQII